MVPVCTVHCIPSPPGGGGGRLFISMHAITPSCVTIRKFPKEAAGFFFLIPNIEMYREGRSKPYSTPNRIVTRATEC